MLKLQLLGLRVTFYGWEIWNLVDHLGGQLDKSSPGWHQAGALF
jgi:hypothetical protein